MHALHDFFSTKKSMKKLMRKNSQNASKMVPKMEPKSTKISRKSISGPSWKQPLKKCPKSPLPELPRPSKTWISCNRGIKNQVFGMSPKTSKKRPPGTLFWHHFGAKIMKNGVLEPFENTSKKQHKKTSKIAPK